MNQNRLPLWLIKLIRYEFWPVYVFYFPFIFYWLYLSIKARDLCFLFKINPSMILGGALGSEKKEALDCIHEEYKPKTVLIKPGASFKTIKEILVENLLQYPVIVKPNEGERGNGVEKITNDTELRSYLKNQNGDLLIQEFINSLQGIGVFYYKDPATGKGTITSVVVKRFLNVVGNGLSTLDQLISNNLRARFRLEYLRNKYTDQLNDIIDEGKVVYLEPVGNHCRGTEFLDGNHLINARLTQIFDEITAHFPEFDYGRFDIKIEDLDSLYHGKGIKILEVNGVNAEPAHIYDRSYNIIGAYKDVKKQFDIMYLIYKTKYAKRHNELGLADTYNLIKNHINHKKTKKLNSSTNFIKI
ncbi:MAG: hypothetical protein ACPGLV_06995 [Bacteroidia bacterium]